MTQTMFCRVAFSRWRRISGERFSIAISAPASRVRPSNPIRRPELTWSAASAEFRRTFSPGISYAAARPDRHLPDATARPLDRPPDRPPDRVLPPSHRASDASSPAPLSLAASEKYALTERLAASRTSPGTVIVTRTVFAVIQTSY